MTEFFLILLAACLANNLVADHLLGVSPLLAAAQKIDIAVDMALAVTGITTLVAFYFLPVGHLIHYPIAPGKLPAAHHGHDRRVRLPGYPGKYRAGISPACLTGTAGSIRCY